MKIVVAENVSLMSTILSPISLTLLGGGAILGAGFVGLYLHQKKNINNNNISRDEELVEDKSSTEIVVEGITLPSSSSFPTYRVQNYLLSTYKYVALELTVATTAAYCTHKLGFSEGILRSLSGKAWWFWIGGAVLQSSLVLTTLLTPKKKPLLKHTALALTSMTIGIPMAPLISYVPSEMLMLAAGGTAGIFGVLSTTALIAPTKMFLKIGSALGVGSLLLSMGSFAGYFMAKSDSAVRMIHGISLYGGLALFSGYMLYDTQLAMRKAETLEDDKLDPINESISLTLDLINVFLRVLQIILENDSDKKKRKRQF